MQNSEEESQKHRNGSVSLPSTMHHSFRKKKKGQNTAKEERELQFIEV